MEALFRRASVRFRSFYFILGKYHAILLSDNNTLIEFRESVSVRNKTSKHAISTVQFVVGLGRLFFRIDFPNAETFFCCFETAQGFVIVSQNFDETFYHRIVDFSDINFSAD